MEHSSETMMITIEENTGHPIEYWIEVVRRSGIHKFEDIVEFLIKHEGMSPNLAEFIAEMAKGPDAIH